MHPHTLLTQQQDIYEEQNDHQQLSTMFTAAAAAKKTGVAALAAARAFSTTKAAAAKVRYFRQSIDLSICLSWMRPASFLLPSTLQHPPHDMTNPCFSQKTTQVAVVGASGGIGQPLSMLLKLDKGVTELSLYDIVHTPGVAADLSHIPTKSKVAGHKGACVRACIGRR